jgi:hypothetical protein
LTLPTDWTPAWIRICQNHLWARGKEYASFGRRQLHPCFTLDELAFALRHHCHPCGRTFYFENLCFLHLAKGADDWITIKEDTYLTTLHFKPHIEDGTFCDYIRTLQETPEQRLRRSVLEVIRSMNTT